MSSPHSYVKSISLSGKVSEDGVFGRKLRLAEVEEEGVSLFSSYI